MLDFVKKMLGFSKPQVQEPAIIDKEVVIDVIDLNSITTKVDGIGHESVKVEKKAKAPAKPKAPKVEKTAAKPKKAKTAKS